SFNDKFMKLRPGKLSAQGARMAPADMVRGAITGAKEAAAEFAERPVGSMVDAVKHVAEHQNATGIARKFADMLTTNDQYAQRPQVQRLVPQARPIFDMIERQGVMANELKKPGTTLVGRMLRLQQDNPERFEKFSRLVNDQTMYGVNGAHALGTGDNSYLALSKVNQAKVAKGKFNEADANTAHWAARGAHKDMNDRYKQITGEDPRYADMQKDLFSFFKEAQGAMVRGH